MTLEYLAEQKSKYQSKKEYFDKIGFDNLGKEFEAVVSLIKEMESHITEFSNIQETEDT